MGKSKKYQTSNPKNTIGLGNPNLPQPKFQKNKGIGDTGKDFHDPKYKVGSGC